MSLTRRDCTQDLSICLCRSCFNSRFLCKGQSTKRVCYNCLSSGQQLTQTDLWCFVICSTLCDPYLNLFRGLIPPIGGTLDLSPILALVVLDVSCLSLHCAGISACKATAIKCQYICLAHLWPADKFCSVPFWWHVGCCSSV